MSKASTRTVSADIPDWTREQPRQFWDPGRKLLASIRAYQSIDRSKTRDYVFRRRLIQLRHIFWSAITGADIPLNCSIGGGLLIPHPNGIVIHPRAKVGVNCLIFQQVTIGNREGSDAPEIAGHVDIGAGAKILGGVKIGAHALIGANAVVIQDVPSESVAIGVPATVRPTRHAL